MGHERGMDSGLDQAEVSVGAESLPGRSVTIVFVGGNEQQADYRQHVEEAIAGEFPRASLDFEFPGWGGNWGKTAKSVGQRLDRADAVVVMRFIRTHLGRAVRRMASDRDLPWIPCTGHGRGLVSRLTWPAVRPLQSSIAKLSGYTQVSWLESRIAVSLNRDRTARDDRRAANR